MGRLLLGGEACWLIQKITRTPSEELPAAQTAWGRAGLHQRWKTTAWYSLPVPRCILGFKGELLTAFALYNCRKRTCCTSVALSSSSEHTLSAGTWPCCPSLVGTCISSSLRLVSRGWPEGPPQERLGPQCRGQVGLAVGEDMLSLHGYPLAPSQ